MPLLAYGINHQTAPLAIRERLAVADDHIPAILSDLLSQAAVNEAVLLSTCNRTEIYTSIDSTVDLERWLTARRGVSDQTISTYSYHHYDYQAIRHLMRVASGLDSMVLGESQIFGQLKQAFHQSCVAGGVGTELMHLFQAAFSAAKRIRSQTA